MRFSTVITTGLLTAFTAAEAYSNVYGLADDKILWGPGGKPNGLKMLKRQATTPTPSVKASSTSVAPTSARVADSSCSNGPLTRSCWSNGFSIATDFDTKWPNTGKTVEYSLEITNTTCNPDGNGDRLCMLINKQYPGPTLIANWGDRINIKVKNSLQNNGTSIHWHGLRQLNSVAQDGVNGITECPLAPGDTKTYSFLATQYGTTW
jgi:hypothetical protein